MGINENHINFFISFPRSFPRYLSSSPFPFPPFPFHLNFPFLFNFGNFSTLPSFYPILADLIFEAVQFLSFYWQILGFQFPIPLAVFGFGEFRGRYIVLGCPCLCCVRCCCNGCFAESDTVKHDYLCKQLWHLQRWWCCSY